MTALGTTIGDDLTANLLAVGRPRRTNCHEGLLALADGRSPVGEVAAST